MKKFVILLLLMFPFVSYANVIGLATTSVVSVIIPEEISVEKAETFPITENPIVVTVPLIKIDSRELRCLQENIYFEARGEGQAGMVAVAKVTMNRAEHPRYPSSVCGVVKQKYKGICQFSWFCDGSKKNGPKLIRDAERVAWEKAGEIARSAFEGTLRTVVGSATHFHTTSVRPSWSKRIQRIVRVGSHIFYREN